MSSPELSNQAVGWHGTQHKTANLQRKANEQRSRMILRPLVMTSQKMTYIIYCIDLSRPDEMTSVLSIQSLQDEVAYHTAVIRVHASGQWMKWVLTHLKECDFKKTKRKDSEDSWSKHFWGSAGCVFCFLIDSLLWFLHFELPSKNLECRL